MQAVVVINLIRTVYYLFFKLLTLPFLRFPRVLYGMAKIMAVVRSRVGYVGRGKSRKSYLGHMARALPEFDRRQLVKLLKAFWFVHQSNFIELFYLPTINPNNVDQKVEFVGLAHLEKARQEGKGIVLAAHYFGNERVIHLALGMKGCPVHVLSSRYAESPSIVRHLRLSMAERYARVHFPEEGPQPLLQALREGEIVQYSPPALGDVDSMRLDFLNHPVEFSTTPVRMAHITGAILTTAWVHRLPGGRFRIVLDEPLPAPIPPDRRLWTRALAERMERYIRQYPQEFYWMWLQIQSEETVPLKEEGKFKRE
jgi:lauroyl/myristoyl acyltransferase